MLYFVYGRSYLEPLAECSMSQYVGFNGPIITWGLILAHSSKLRMNMCYMFDFGRGVNKKQTDSTCK